MTDKLAIMERNQGYEADKIDLIKKTVAVGATYLELQLFLHQAQKSGLDPLARQIYFVKRQGKGTIQTGIDGYRLIADRTNKYAGNDDYEFDDPEGQPKWAKATVYKMVEGQRCSFAATARWSQYFPGDAQGFMWKKMPHVMLGKCAEALALRKAFPAELSGLYTADEMAQADKGPPTREELEQGAVAFEQERSKTETAMIDQLKRSVLKETAKKFGWAAKDYSTLLGKWGYESPAEISDRDYEGILEQLKKDGPVQPPEAATATSKPEPTYDPSVSQEAPKPFLLTLVVNKVSPPKAGKKAWFVAGTDGKKLWDLSSFHGNTMVEMDEIGMVGEECELLVVESGKYTNIQGWRRIGNRKNEALPDDVILQG